MEEVTAKTAEEFGFTAKNIKKHKYMYICKGERETRIIKKTSLDKESIMLVYEFKKYLFENGFKNTDKYFLSKSGEPYYCSGESTFIMTEYINAPEASFSDADIFLDIVKAVAEFHKAGKGFAANEHRLRENNISEEMKKGIQSLENIRKSLRGKKHFKEYDVKFMKNYEMICAHTKTAYETAISTDIKDSVSVCHNGLKEETISTADKVYITGMDELSKNGAVVDLADIIERYMRKHDEKYVGIEKILSVYSEINKLSKNDERMLYAMLLFPKGYIKASKAMYAKKRNWVPIGAERKFSRMAELQAENERYIRPIRCER